MIVTSNVTDKIEMLFLVNCSAPDDEDFCNGDRGCCTKKLAVILSFNVLQHHTMKASPRHWM